ncbi:hypothetical protein L208DRAFT_1472956 [Tricholoma matsutake]|nr:hypothetical protein L208DRAFT_1472956 [Tricholoma matsutake 945]
MQEKQTSFEVKTGNSANARKKESKGSLNSNSNSNTQSKPQSSSNSNHTKQSSPGNSSGSKNNFQRDKPKNSISAKLWKDSKLTGDECECHMKEGLCLCCDEKGHGARNCSKAKAAKVCTAAVTESTADSKK